MDELEYHIKFSDGTSATRRGSVGMLRAEFPDQGSIMSVRSRRVTDGQPRGSALVTRSDDQCIFAAAVDASRIDAQKRNSPVVSAR